jgi:uncharacterized hydantoinase/oxoprolinase family protein
MEKELVDGLKTAFETGRVYDFIAKNYWKMSKDELKDILLEIVDAETRGMNGEEMTAEFAEAFEGIKDNTTIFEED